MPPSDGECNQDDCSEASGDEERPSGIVKHWNLAGPLFRLTESKEKAIMRVRYVLSVFLLSWTLTRTSISFRPYLRVFATLMYHENIKRMSIETFFLQGKYSDSQKHESSCLFSDRFWCISPEPFEVQKIFFHYMHHFLKSFQIE